MGSASSDIATTMPGTAERGRTTRAAGALAALGAAPFAAARLLDGAGAGGLALPCPFRELTGLPCPLCGATRAVALAAHGDLRFLDYGAVWVAVLAALAVVGLAALVTRRRLPSPPALPLAVATTAVAWAYALARHATIAP